MDSHPNFMSLMELQRILMALFLWLTWAIIAFANSRVLFAQLTTTAQLAHLLFAPKAFFAP
jgi:hypothetical protein